MQFYLNKTLITKNDLNWFTEVFLLVPFLNKNIYYTDLLSIIGPHNEGLYTKLFYTGKQFIKETDIEKCDFSLIPFKYNERDTRIKSIILEAKKYNKTVITFFNDDNTDNINIDPNVILFRTSLYKTKQKSNERVFPALVPDHFHKDYKCNENGISFCGCLTQLRYEIINQLKQLSLQLDFIVRSGFWAPEINCKIKARQQYNTNLLNNKYALCIRGAGNFSYRFYEALSFGRIPILIDTDTILPFSNVIDWNKHIIFIKQEDIKDLPELLKNDTRSMTENRKLWEKYFSVEGYANSFTKDI